MFTAEEYYRYSLVYAQEREKSKALLESLLQERAEAAKRRRKATNRDEKLVSRLSAEEHSEYMNLLRCQQQPNVASNQPKELVRFMELQDRVKEEQREFLQLWPQVPGRRTETLAKGLDTWAREHHDKLKKGLPKGPWVTACNLKISSLLLIPAAQPGFLKHIMFEAGIVARPEIGCPLLPSKPLEGPPNAQETSGKSSKGQPSSSIKDTYEEVLTHVPNAALLVDLEVLLTDWHGSAWLLPVRVTDGGVVFIGATLPSGNLRNWNDHFLNWALLKWIEEHQAKGGATSGASSAMATPDAGVKEQGTNPPLSGGDMWYGLWELTPGGKQVLLRHQAWKDTSGELCAVVTKTEYQTPLGAEVLSDRERLQQAALLALIPHLMRVRVDVRSGNVVLVEEHRCQPNQNVTLKKLFGPLNALIDHLHGLDPGMYLLSHQAGEPDAQLLILGAGNGWDLHYELNRRFPQKLPVTALSAARDQRPPPLDPEVVFEEHFRRGRAPLTFPPAQPSTTAKEGAGTSLRSPCERVLGPSKQCPAVHCRRILRSGSAVSSSGKPVRRAVALNMVDKK
uniref:Nmda receptor-regulated protein 2 n=1 Tax=Rhipicephalus zambeziensis TaxID=60191 RepID=A0A224YM92_9ACAR